MALNYNFKAETNDIVRSLGFGSYEEAIAKLYETKTAKEVGRIFGRHETGIRMHLKKIGIDRKPQGGNRSKRVSVSQTAYFEIMSGRERWSFYAVKYKISLASVGRIRRGYIPVITQDGE